MTDLRLLQAHAPSDRTVWRAGLVSLVLATIGCFGVLALILITYPSSTWIVGMGLLAGASAWWTVRHPLVYLFSVLSFVAFTSDYELGFRYARLRTCCITLSFCSFGSFPVWLRGSGVWPCCRSRKTDSCLVFY